MQLMPRSQLRGESQDGSSPMIQRLHDTFTLAQKARDNLINFRAKIPFLSLAEVNEEYIRALPINRPDHPNTNKRFGDLFMAALAEYSNAVIGQSIVMHCGCGQEHKISLQTLRNHMASPEAFYHAPVSSTATPVKITLSVNPQEKTTEDIQEFFTASSHHEQYLFVCPHITRMLKVAFPQAYEVWRKLKTHVSNSVQLRDPIEAPWQWFRKDFGFLAFMEDVGMPSAVTDKLKRRPERKCYKAVQFYWEDRDRIRSVRSSLVESSPTTRLLTQRYHSAVARAKAAGRRVHFLDVKHFIDTIPELPTDFEEDPRAWRLQYRDQDMHGIGPNNAHWVRTLAVNVRVKESERRLKAAEIGIDLIAALGIESQKDFLRRVRMFIYELDKLNSQEMYCADPVEVPITVNGVTMVLPDVMETLFRRVRDHVFDDNEEENSDNK